MSHHVRCTEPGAGDDLVVVDAVVSVMVSAADTADSYELFELSGPAGSGAPLSRHPWAEAYYMLDGTADVQVGARRFSVGPGAAVTIPPHAAHALRFTAPSTRMLVVSLTGAGGRFFSDMDANVRLADGPEVFGPQIAAVAERNGVTLLQEAPA